MKDVLAVILAGGRGSRLEPLTRDRAKPAVPFGGIYRIVDFALSNCLNSGMRKILLLTQYKAMSLDRHINMGWRQYFCRELGEFIDIVPPQQRIDEQWYQGTADAVYQNIYAMEKERPKYVVILAGDHIYKMNYASMVQFHIERNAELTIGALPVTRKEAQAFGVMQIDTDQRIVGFDEKPKDPKTIPGTTDTCLASMGIYVFNSEFLFEQLCRDATLAESAHDFGKNIIPSIIQSHRVFSFPFEDENRKSKAYWRDVGTIDAFYQANMDLISVDPMLNLYDSKWPIRTYQVNSPPPKFVFGSKAGDSDPRQGLAIDSVVCNGVIISGAQVTRSIIGPGCRINDYAEIDSSILFDEVSVGRGVRIKNAIIEKGVVIPEGISIGFDPLEDRKRGFTVSENGITVIAKGELIPNVQQTQESGMLRQPFYRQSRDRASTEL